MRPHHLRMGVALFLLAAAAAALADVQPAGGPAAPGIAGDWIIDREASDPPRAMGGEGRGGDGQRGGPGTGGGGMGGPGMGGPGMGGGRSGGGMGRGGGQAPGGSRQPPSEEEMKRRRALLQELATPPSRLTVRLDATTVAFVDETARVRKYSTDGRSEKHQFTNATVETRVRWREGGLTIEASLESGARLVRRYEVMSEPHRLVVTTKLTGGPMGGDAPEMKTVYLPLEE